MLSFFKKNILRKKENASVLEININYIFNDKTLLKTALTHPSSKSKLYGDYQRLEFLGDTILNYIVSDYLFKIFPFDSEGSLTVKRANIVNSSTLGDKGVELNLINDSYIDASIDLNNKKVVNSISSDIYEALIGAIRIDSNLYKAKCFIELTLLDSNLELGFDNNHKGKLIELCHQKNLETPNFNNITSSGPSHKKNYTIKLIIDGQSYEGKGTSIKEAQQNASEKALLKLI